MMPEDFAAESDRQRIDAADALRKEADGYLAKGTHEWALEFDVEHSSREMFVRAVRVASRLDDLLECTAGNVERVVFRPYPSKHDGAWRIEILFNRVGPWAGKEWYVSEEQLWAAWEKAKGFV